jgi:hypothetical protein
MHRSHTSRAFALALSSVALIGMSVPAFSETLIVEEIPGVCFDDRERTFFIDEENREECQPFAERMNYDDTGRLVTGSIPTGSATNPNTVTDPDVNIGGPDVDAVGSTDGSTGADGPPDGSDSTGGTDVSDGRGNNGFGNVGDDPAPGNSDSASADGDGSKGADSVR